MARTFSQRELDRQVVDMVADARTRFGIPEGCDGETACAKIGLNLRSGPLGPARDGLLTKGNVVVNRTLRWAPRIEFTIFHEIFHYLLEEDGEIIELYTEILRSDDAAYKAAIERCCHQGAAEFLMPQARVRDAISTNGFSVELVEFIAERHGASIVASAIQVARCAPVDCYVVICSHGLAPRSSPPHRGLFVEYAASSPQIKYTLGRFSPVQDDNLLVQAWEAQGHMRGPSYVPFRSAARMRRENRMECQCDAMRLGDRVLGILFLEAPTPPGQLTLSFDDA
jgi:hypothetical protein